jgi:hypothetical protein
MGLQLAEKNPTIIKNNNADGKKMQRKIMTKKML